MPVAGHWKRSRAPIAVAACICVVVSCADSGSVASSAQVAAETTSAVRPSTTSTTSTPRVPGTTTAPTTNPPPATTLPDAPGAGTGSGPASLPGFAPRTSPDVASDPAGLARQITDSERAVRDPATPPERRAEAAHVLQVAYRVLADRREWDAEVAAAMPQDLWHSLLSNVAARRELRGMHTRLLDHVPAWRIVEPRPAEELLAHYREAEQAFGVGWEYLAAIHLVETAMGRVDAVSTAGAMGPMQFMPGTWNAFGRGDVHDPRDAILAAGRYLAHSGAPADMHAALFSYNRHNRYVRAIMHFASVMRADPAAYLGYHHWQVYLLTVAGDVLLPVGYDAPEPVPVEAFLSRPG
jgi:hypothetical protein